MTTLAHPPSIATSAQPDIIDMLADVPEPTPERVLAARKAAGQSQAEAATLAGYSDKMRWSNLERGVTTMDRPRWAMYLLAIGAHPALQVVRRQMLTVK